MNLTRLEKLEKAIERCKCSKVILSIDGEQKAVSFDEAFGIAVDDCFLRDHKVIIVEERGNLLSALIEGFYKDPTPAEWG